MICGADITSSRLRDDWRGCVTAYRWFRPNDFARALRSILGLGDNESFAQGLILCGKIFELQYGCIGLQVAFETGIISQPTSSPKRHATKINDCTHTNAMQNTGVSSLKSISHSGPGTNSMTRFDPPTIRVDPGRGRRRVPCPGRYLMDTLVIETRQSDRSYFIGSQSLLVSFHRWLSGAVS
jgi:hypothetical protein